MQKILIIEDDQLLSHMYETIFTEHGFAVTLAADGKTGLSQVYAVKPNVVLLDIVMPQLDGMGVLRSLHADDELKRIPVVVITNLTDSASVQTALDLGAAQYVTKSEHKPAQVVDIVSDVLKRNHVKGV